MSTAAAKATPDEYEATEISDEAVPKAALMRPDQMEDLLVVRGGRQLPVFKGNAWEEHVSTWMHLAEQTDNYQWFLGAIAASVEKKYGTDAKGQFAKDVGIGRTTVYEYAKVYQAYQKSGRVEGLSFSLHAVALAAERPQRLLAKAAKEGWSVRDLKSHIKGSAPEEQSLPEFVFKFRPRKRNEKKDAYKAEATKEFKNELTSFLA